MWPKRKQRFYLRTTQSPTYANLDRYLREQNWTATRFSALADFSEKNFDFNTAAAQCLEFKHLAAALLEKYCPDAAPESWILNDSNWIEVLDNMALMPARQSSAWILKPSLLNNGQYIKIFPELAETACHFLSADRMGGEHVLQRYVTNPHLLKGHKYSLRMFVVLSSQTGAWLYPQGYYNVARHAYEPENFQLLNSHLTNEHLTETETNVIQIPSSEFAEFTAHYPKIKTMARTVTNALCAEFPEAFKSQKNTLAIFGFDFMLDSELRLWFLEANHGPCFPVDSSHPLQKYLYQHFWQNFIRRFVTFNEENTFERL